MTQTEFKQLVSQREYNFIREDEHLKGRILFLTLGGSHAYGTNVATSDVDVRGCALNSPSDLLGLTNFEQRIDKATDTTIYGFNKFISLLTTCSPNMVELLGCKPEHYIFGNDIGKELIANRKMFFSQRAIGTFGGYATQQLRRLENALARDQLPQEKKEGHILDSMNHALEMKEGPQGIKLFIDDSPSPELDVEIFADISLKRVPVRTFHCLLNELGSIVRLYDKPGKRNHKKDAAHLNKHAMHLIRLLITGAELLETGDIVTNRENDLDLLMSIRNGAFMDLDGTYRQEFFDMVEEYGKRLEYAKQNTVLPEKPNMKRIEEFVMEVNRKSIQ